jgi:hypothetical protein
VTRSGRAAARPRRLGGAASALLVAAALAGALAAGCGRADWRVVQLYGGQGSLEILSGPERVEVFRVESQPSRPEAGEGAAQRVGEFRVTAGPQVLDEGGAAELAAILRDPATYDWHRAKGDPFRPTVGVRFRRGASRLELVLDFESAMLLAYRHGRRVGVEDFDDVRDRVRELVAGAAGE